MNQEYINPIFEAAKSVLKNMMQIEVERGELALKESPFSAKKVNASIGVTGNLKGFIYYSMSEETALEVFTKMSGMTMDEFDELVSSAIGELANIITGNSLTRLSELNYQCDITPPSITYGDNVKITTNQRKFLVIPLNTGIGDFEINVSLEEKK